MASSGPLRHCGSLHLMFWYFEADKAFVTGLNLQNMTIA